MKKTALFVLLSVVFFTATVALASFMSFPEDQTPSTGAYLWIIDGAEDYRTTIEDITDTITDDFLDGAESIIFSDDGDGADEVGMLTYDNDSGNMDEGGLVFHDGSRERLIVDLHSNPAGIADDGKMVSYNDLNERFQLIHPDGDNVSFDDTNSDYVAADVSGAIEELVDANGSGPNAADGKVNWEQLVDVPAGFADGTDDGAGGGSGTMTTVKEGDAQVGGADIVTIDFGPGFDVAETPDTEVQITLDLTEKQVDLTSEVTGVLPDGNVANDITIDLATTVTTNANLTGDVTSVGNATDITESVLQDGGTDELAVTAGMMNTGTGASSATYWRGDNTWATPSGSGDVTKVPTPVNDQVGVWTGDGTLEGDADLTFDGNILTTNGLVSNAGMETKNGATTSGFIDFYEDSTNGTNYARIISPDGIGTNYTLTLPQDDGDTGEFLLTDGSGNTSWGGTATYVNVDGTNPMTGEFTVDNLGVEFTAGDDHSDCSAFSATGGGIFFDDSEGIFKKCQDNVLTDMDTGAGTVNTADIADVNVTQTELEELETIEATTISEAQWTGLGGATTAGIALWDDANAPAQLITLGVNATASEINTPLDGASVTLTEFQELEAIDATTISAAQWGYLGELDQALTTTDDVTFGSIDVTAIEDPLWTFDALDAQDTDWSIGTNADAGATSDDDLEFRTSATPGSGVVMSLQPDTGNMVLNGTIYLAEQVEADADVATYGQIWVNTATPNELWWTDDAGTDTQLGIAGSDDQTLAEVLASGADANDVNITSLAEIALDLVDADGANIAIGDDDETIEIHSSDWDISTTGVQTGMGNITSDGTIQTTDFQILDDFPAISFMDDDATGDPIVVDMYAQENSGGAGTEVADFRIRVAQGATPLDDADSVIFYDQSFDTLNILSSLAAADSVYINDGVSLTFKEDAADPDDAEIEFTAADGVLTIAAVDGANNEDLTIDLDQTANTAIVNTSTGVDEIEFTSMNVKALSFESDPTAEPGYTAYDLQGEGADDTAGRLYWDMTTTTDGDEDSDSFWQVMQDGALTTFAQLDESAGYDGEIIAARPITTPATTTNTAGLNLPHGTEPGSPVNGDVWTTTSGIYAQIDGSTEGPFGAGGIPTQITVADTSDTTTFVALFDDATGDLGPKTDASNLIYNASNGLFQSNIIIGNTTLDPGNPAMGANDATPAENGVIFEGTAADAHEGLLKWDVADSDKTLSLQNITGTIYSTGGTDVSVADGGTNSSTALNNDFVIISSGGAIVESATVTTTELALLNGETDLATQDELDTVAGLVDSASELLAIMDNTALDFGTGVITAAGFVGPLTGTASSATAAASQVITDNAILTVDDAGNGVDNEYPRFTAAGLESRSPTEMVAEFDDIAWTFGAIAVNLSAATVTLPSSQTLTTPNIGAATGTSLDISGAAGLTLENDETITNTVDGTIDFGAAILTSTGNLHGSIEIIADDESISAAQCYGSINKTNGLATFTLPAAVVGMNILIYSDDATVKTIDPNGTDHIWLNGADNGAGNSIDSPGAVGDFIVLVAMSSNNWYSLGQSGTWIDTP